MFKREGEYRSGTLNKKAAISVIAIIAAFILLLVYAPMFYMNGNIS